MQLRRTSLLSDAPPSASGMQPHRDRRVHWSSLVRPEIARIHNRGSSTQINHARQSARLVAARMRWDLQPKHAVPNRANTATELQSRVT
jgi:hypothetical protein